MLGHLIDAFQLGVMKNNIGQVNLLHGLVDFPLTSPVGLVRTKVFMSHTYVVLF